MLWDDYMTSIAERLKEPEQAYLNARIMTGLPYVKRDDLEDVLHASLVQALREVEQSDWEAFSSLAVQHITGGPNVVEMPLNLVRILGASVDNGAAVQCSVANYFQWATGNSKYTNQYALFSGNCNFQGTSIDLRILVEPSLRDWKLAQTPVLPPGSDIRVIDIAVKRVIISDYVPEWRP